MLAEKISPLYFQIPVIFTLIHSTEGAFRLLGFGGSFVSCFVWLVWFDLVFWFGEFLVGLFCFLGFFILVFVRLLLISSH